MKRPIVYMFVGSVEQKKETAFAVTSHAAKSNDKLHSDTSPDYLANQQSSLNEN